MYLTRYITSFVFQEQINLASLQNLYRLPRCTISAFLPDVLLAVSEVPGNYIKVPESEEEWRHIEEGFSVQ
ncbi:unnamed protein product [Acanthoscelides obtectus]|uniref:Uncharacterized protein n=1 Tax=Acanthoscelides obtectus TaxID=200917 RepID=A0A9P0P8G2_ACAOB|nr:unnamed protein product [Acanthoscelides obtectus]CAK1622993.1 hypothetical protein AOBTE_LOCUS1763 [Acanthoscelides obtectus]